MRRCDDGATARPDLDLDEAAGLEDAHRLANRHPAHAHALAQIALARQAITRAQLLAADEAADLLHDGLGHAVGRDRLVEVSARGSDFAHGLFLESGERS
jgi:predicted signal transduction protein with EAL and GGDEF domain